MQMRPMLMAPSATRRLAVIIRLWSLIAVALALDRVDGFPIYGPSAVGFN